MLHRLLTPVVVLGLALGAAAPAQARGHTVTADIIDTAAGRGNVVSLTFDDGPTATDTPRLLQVLRKHRVKAVFCVQGNRTLENPQLIRRIVAAGHTLCNHTMEHDDLAPLSAEEIRADLAETNRVIRRALPHASIPYFRAPFG